MTFNKQIGRPLALALVAAALAGANVARGEGPATAPATGPATGMAKTVDNPEYAMWSKFKPGSSVTLSGDIVGPMGKATMQLTRTLKSVDADGVMVETAAKVTAMGRVQTPPAQTEKVEAKEEKEESKQVGTADVTASGKTYACKVFEQPSKVPGGGAAEKLYMTPEVPGGVVKLEAPGPMGVTVTLTLTAADAK